MNKLSKSETLANPLQIVSVLSNAICKSKPFGMMDVHGPRVDRRFQGVFGVRQVGQGKAHGWFSWVWIGKSTDPEAIMGFAGLGSGP